MKQWIQTFTGKQFYPHEPTADMICIEDIAHGLSNVCRYTGQCPTFYSVGHHSLIVANIIYKRTNDVKLTLEALLHDASEAYLCDIPKPLKILLPDYQKIEDNVSKVIYDKYNIKYPLNPSIKVADIEILAKEHEDLIENIYDLSFEYKAPEELKTVAIQSIYSEDIELIFKTVFNDLINDNTDAISDDFSIIWR